MSDVRVTLRFEDHLAPTLAAIGGLVRLVSVPDLLPPLPKELCRTVNVLADDRSSITVIVLPTPQLLHWASIAADVVTRSLSKVQAPSVAKHLDCPTVGDVSTLFINNRPVDEWPSV